MCGRLSPDRRAIRWRTLPSVVENGAEARKRASRGGRRLCVVLGMSHVRAFLLRIVHFGQVGMWLYMTNG